MLAARIWAHQNQAQNEVFRYFVEFGSYVFYEIAYSDSLRHCLTCIRGKPHDKILGVEIWAKRVKIGPEVCIITFP